MLEKFNNDLLDAMKKGEKEKLQVLRMIKGDMKNQVIDHKKEMNDELLIDVVSHGIKTRNESIESFKKGNREDLVEKTQNEIDILKEYLPVQLSLDEVNLILDEVFKKVNPTSQKDMGLIMKEVTPLLKGKTDMKTVSELIKERLSNL